MRILQICVSLAPRKLARNGGELRYWQNLSSLVALGHEVYLVLCQDPREREALEPEVRQLPKAIELVDMPNWARTRFQSWMSLTSGQAALRWYLRCTPTLRDQVARLADRIEPDVIWAEWIGGVAAAPTGRPLVYAHTDCYHKVLGVSSASSGRGNPLLERLRLARLREMELSLSARADHVVCASASERKQLDPIAKASSYIPIVGPGVPRSSAPANGTARVFFFGTWICTAMRLSIRHFRERVWPLLASDRPNLEWHQVGKADPRASEDWQWITKEFACHGFVEDLGGLFRVGDACLVPYTEDTGFRSKFVTATAYGVVNVGYRRSFVCAPEFTRGRDCLVADSPQEMADHLRRYGQDAGMRRRLGEASRDLYERAFSYEAQLPKYEQVLRQMIGSRRVPS